ncbi:DUF1289 domain-containing protein [Hydrogenophaga sp.]|uniref:DUF1289 domain-containing protein n=1 Tax=Hydrogenophaga sp. TaxID=1904254 RepID=UPI00356B47C8
MTSTPIINLQDARERHPGVVAPSPCVSICELDHAHSRCHGCFRTLDEIAGWGQLDDAAKLVIWQRIEARQTTTSP